MQGCTTNNTHKQSIQSKFVSVQQSLGLTHSLYEAKFVYSQQQLPGPESYLYKKHQPSICQSIGFSLDEIRIINGLAAKMIYYAGKILNVPISTTILAQNLIHFFYARKNYLDYDIRDVIIGAMYLACKSQQTLKKSYQIVIAFDHVFKVLEGQKLPKNIQIEGSQYNYMKKNKLIDSQIDILFQLGFQVYRLMDLPHRHLGSFLNLFEKHPRHQQISKYTIKVLNDIYFTIACLYYTPQILASAALYISMIQLKIEFATIPWWTLMEAKLQDLEDIYMQILNFRRLSLQINLQKVHQIIQRVAMQNEGTRNVFPLPYYRRIWLSRNGKIRIKKKQQDIISKIQQRIQKKQQEQPQIEKKENLVIQQMLELEKFQQNHSESSDSQREKKKRKKHKNKNKAKSQKHIKKQKKKKKKKYTHKDSNIHNKNDHNKDDHNKEDHSKDDHNKHDHNKEDHSKDDHSKGDQRQKDKNRQQIQGQKIEQGSKTKEYQKKQENIDGQKKSSDLLNLSKNNLLSSINKQLSKHKQRIHKRQQKEEQMIEKKVQEQKKNKNIEMQDSEDQQIRLIQQLKKKVKLNRENKDK